MTTVELSTLEVGQGLEYTQIRSMYISFDVSILCEMIF